jgi:xanthine dehydrogenase YagS FAD-binding subunit
LPPSAFAECSQYLKIRDRHSYAFALVSVAAGLVIRSGVIDAAAIAMGGVSAKPWRMREAESSLLGKPPAAEAFHLAAQLAMRDAQPLTQNAFKVDLGRHSVVRALTLACRGNNDAA